MYHHKTESHTALCDTHSQCRPNWEPGSGDWNDKTTTKKKKTNLSGTKHFPSLPHLLDSQMWAMPQPTHITRNSDLEALVAH